MCYSNVVKQEQTMSKHRFETADEEMIRLLLELKMGKAGGKWNVLFELLHKMYPERDTGYSDMQLLDILREQVPLQPPEVDGRV